MWPPLAALCLVLGGCGDRPPDAPSAPAPIVGRQPISTDLIAQCAAVCARPPTATIDAATAHQFRHLGNGWDDGETTADGAIVWLTAGRATITFDAGPAPRDGWIEFDARVDHDGRRGETISVLANDRPLGRVRLDGVAPSGRFALPARRLHPGQNRLTVQAPGHHRARGDRIGLRQIRFTSDTPVPPVPSRDDHGRLSIPAGARAELFVRVPDAAHLTVELDAESQGGLRATIQVDAQPERPLALPDADLSPEAGRMARIVLSAGGPDALVRSARVAGVHETAVAPPPSGAARPNVVLVVVDTLRADHLGCYGYPLPTTPHLDALAHEAVLFERAVAQSSWTRPSVGSLLTGQLPIEHRAITLMDRLRDDVPTLAGLLRDAGYRTAGIVTNINVSARFGFSRGFDDWEQLPEHEDDEAVYAAASVLDARAFAWLDARDARPFFLYLHASDPHAPYRPSPQSAARFTSPDLHPTIDRRTQMADIVGEPGRLSTDDVAFLRGLYDGDVAAADEGVGALIAKLRALRLLDTTLFVFVADHGEEFADHGGFEHGRTLFGELLHVPLVIRLPGGRGGGRRVATLARQVDVFATVLWQLGLSAPAGTVGVPLLTADGTPLPPPPDAFSHTAMGRRRELTALTEDHWRVVFDASGGSPWLYDLAADPHEQADVSARYPIVAGTLRQTAEQYRVTGTPPPPGAAGRVVDPDLQRRLESLGYVDAHEP